MSDPIAERYERDGFCCPIMIMDAHEANEWRGKLEAVERRYTSDPDCLPRPLNNYLRVNAHIVLPFAHRLASDPRILAVVKQVLGPDILAWSAEFFTKEAHTNKVVTWHQDLTYWGIGSTDNEVTAWLTLSPSTPESGCMRFIPNSHKHDLLPHNDSFAADNLLSRGQEIAVEVNEANAVSIELQPGELSLHHGRLFHASGPNTSDDRRIGFAIRYITPAVKQTIAKQDYAMSVLGSGDTGSFIPITGPKAEFDAESMALYEKVLADQSPVFSQDADQNLPLYD